MKHLFAMTALTSMALAGCEANRTEYIGTNVAIPQITVSATGESTVSPDQASVSAGVVTQGKTAAVAMQSNAKLMSAVFEQLDKAGIAKKDIATSQLSLQPRYDYSNRQSPRITQYEARNTVTVKTGDLENVGPMIDALITAGLNNINQVQFSVKDPKAARDEARIAAIKEAREKASNMAKAAGVGLGDLQSLSESGGYTPQPIYRMQAESYGASDAVTPVAAGQQTLSVTVNMVYAIED